MKKKCGKNYFKGPKMAAKDDATILFAATILTAPTVYVYIYGTLAYAYTVYMYMYIYVNIPVEVA